MEDEVGVLRYILRFGVVFLVLSLGITGLLLLLMRNSDLPIYGIPGSTLCALIVAAIAAVSRFLQDNRRVPTGQEKTRLIWLSFLISWFILALLFGAAVMLSPEVEKLIEGIRSEGFALIIGFAIFLSVLYLVFLSLAYGNRAKKSFEIMRKRGQI